MIKFTLVDVLVISLCAPLILCCSVSSSINTKQQSGGASYETAYQYLSDTNLRKKSFAVPKTLKLGDWQRILTPEQFAVTRLNETERRYSSPLNRLHENGIFRCINCGNSLFSHTSKYESGSGWPSFFQPINDGMAVGTMADHASVLARTEVHCGRCGAHLGHVFGDGPPPTGLRYCINGVAMDFEPHHSEKP